MQVIVIQAHRVFLAGRLFREHVIGEKIEIEAAEYAPNLHQKIKDKKLSADERQQSVAGVQKE